MKRDYNRNTTSDMPMDSNFNSFLDDDKQKKKTKQAISAIGAKAKQKLNKKNIKNDKNVKNIQKSGANRVFANDLDDLEKLNEEHFQTYRYKRRRNRVIIILLSFMLLLAIVTISTYSAINELGANCYMYAHGADTTYVLNGERVGKFRAPSALQGKRILKLNIELDIEEGGMYNIRFIAKCYKSNIRLDNILIYNGNYDLFYEGLDGYWYSNEPIAGNQKIKLCGGIILDDEYEGELTVNNFKMDFHTYLEKV